MATTMYTQYVLLAAMMILVASIQQVQARPHLPPPPPAGGRHCSPAVVAKLGVCVAMQQGRLNLEDWDQCCSQIRLQQDPVCLCAAFSISDAEARALGEAGNDNRGEIIRVACGLQATLPGFACPLSAAPAV